MATTITKSGGAVSRLGAIGSQEWWHCRICGDVWPIARPENSQGVSRAAAEARLHIATHAQAQHSASAAWHRTAALGPSEKQR